LIFQKNFFEQYSSRKTRSIYDYADFKKAADNEIKVAVAADILSLVKLTPGEIGAAVVVGTTQRFESDGLRWTTRRLFC
jgi:glycine dehydrogenase